MIAGEYSVINNQIDLLIKGLYKGDGRNNKEQGLVRSILDAKR